MFWAGESVFGHLLKRHWQLPRLFNHRMLAQCLLADNVFYRHFSSHGGAIWLFDTATEWRLIVLSPITRCLGQSDSVGRSLVSVHAIVCSLLTDVIVPVRRMRNESWSSWVVSQRRRCCWRHSLRLQARTTTSTVFTWLHGEYGESFLKKSAMFIGINCARYVHDISLVYSMFLKKPDLSVVFVLSALGPDCASDSAR